MANDPQDQVVKTDEESQVLPEFIKEDLEKSKHLQEATPNWKEKLKGFVLSTIVPLSGLVSDAIHYPEVANLETDDSEPPIEYKVDDYEYDTPAYMRDAFTYPVQVKDGESVNDLMDYELARHFFPNFKINSFEAFNSNKDFVAAVNNYKQKNPDDYKALNINFKDLVEDMNKDKGIINQDGKFTKSAEIKSVEMTPLVAQQNFNRVFQQLKEADK